MDHLLGSFPFSYWYGDLESREDAERFALVAEGMSNAQLKLRRPDLEVVEFRGNLQTRLKKLDEGVAEATFLAMAGLKRLKMDEVPKTAIEVETMLPAVAQGAIGIERRVDDNRAAEMLEAIHDGTTGQRLAAERAFLAALDGSCETPIAGLAVLDGSTLHLRGEVLRPDGSEAVDDALSCVIEDGAEAGREMAGKLLAQAGEGFFDWRGLPSIRDAVLSALT